MFSKENTKETFKNFIAIQEELKKFVIKDLGLSLLSGINIDTYLMYKLCRYGNLRIGCGDVPDENWTLVRFCYDLKMIWLELKNSKISFVEKFKLFIAQMIVWRLFGVWDKKMLSRKIFELLEVAKDIDGKKYLRWDSRGLVENEKMLDILPKNTILLVEYYPESGHDPDKFWEYISYLNKKYKIQVKVSFDPVHYWRAKNFFSDFKYTPEEMLGRVVANKEWVNLLGMLEVSNVAKNSTQAHSSVLYGEIDFAQIFSILGGANKNGLLKKPFFVVLEFNPTKKDIFLEEIEKFLEEISDNINK